MSKSCQNCEDLAELVAKLQEGCKQKDERLRKFEALFDELPLVAKTTINFKKVL